MSSPAPSHSAIQMVSTVYEDNFVTVTELQLFVRNYYMPSRKERKVNLDQIVVLYFEEQEVSKLSTTRVWGRAIAPIYWALDLKRAFCRVPGLTKGRYNIVVDIGTDTKIGFSVTNIDSFMDHMRELLGYRVIIVNKINV